MIKKISLFAILILFFLLSIEITLRWYGFHNVPLYIADESFQYIYAPSQDVSAKGKRILVNAYSMRSEELSSDDSIRVILIGDSVPNGGVHTDHDSLASTHLEKWLSTALKAKVRVLNISAGSWETDNAAGYIQKYGLFDASMVCLVVNSGDRSDGIFSEPIVGVYADYPAEKPLSALLYVSKKILEQKAIKYNLLPPLPKPDSVTYNGWDYFVSLSKKIPLTILFHPTIKELNGGASAELGSFLTVMQSNQLPYIDGRQCNYNESLYRDKIHLTESGQRHLAGILYRPILDSLNVMIKEGRLKHISR